MLGFRRRIRDQGTHEGPADNPRADPLSFDCRSTRRPTELSQVDPTVGTIEEAASRATFALYARRRQNEHTPRESTGVTPHAVGCEEPHAARRLRAHAAASSTDAENLWFGRLRGVCGDLDAVIPRGAPL